MLRRAGASMASAEALLARLGSKVDALLEERAALQRHAKVLLVEENGR